MSILDFRYILSQKYDSSKSKILGSFSFDKILIDPTTILSSTLISGDLNEVEIGVRKQAAIVMIWRSVGGVNMPSFQTKTLVITPISGDKFRIIPPTCMVS